MATSDGSSISKEEMEMEMEKEKEKAVRGKVRGILSNRMSSAQQRANALELLQEYPALASEVYSETDSPCLETEYTPLAYFILTLSSATATTATATSDKDKEDVRQIQTIFDLYPPAIAFANERGRLPLHEACSETASEDVIAFLATQYPKAASIPDDCGLFPFHHALRGTRHASARTLTLLLDLYPAAFDKRDFGGRWPLRRAIMDGYDASVLKVLYQRLPASIKSYNLPETVDGTLDLIQGLSVLLPRLHTFAALIDRWNHPNAWSALLKELAHRNQSIQTLALKLSRSLFDPSTTTTVSSDSDNSDVNQGLHKLLQSSTCMVRHLTLYGQATRSTTNASLRGGRSGNDNHSFQALHDGFVLSTIPSAAPMDKTRMSRLKELQLCNFQLSDTHLLGSFLASPLAPSRVTLENINIIGSEDVHAVWTGPKERCATVGSIEDLSLRGITGDWICGLLREFLPAPAGITNNELPPRSSPSPLSVLKRLTVESCRPNDDNLQETLIMILRQFLQQTKLETLSVVNLPTNEGCMVPLSEALVHNTSLLEYHVRDHQYNVPGTNDRANERIARKAKEWNESNKACLASLLEHQNTTLQVATLYFDSALPSEDASSDKTADIPDWDGQIDYFTILNSFGRKEARDSGTTRKHMVELLCRTTNMTNCERSTFPSQINVQYGLLRENPSIWSNEKQSSDAAVGILSGRLAGTKRKLR